MVDLFLLILIICLLISTVSIVVFVFYGIKTMNEENETYAKSVEESRKRQKELHDEYLAMKTMTRYLSRKECDGMHIFKYLWLTLSLVMFFAKLAGVITIGWWVALLPLLLFIGFYALIIIIVFIAAIVAEINKDK